MAKKVKSRLADDLRASLREALDYACGKKTGVIVHRVMPRRIDARKARAKLGLRSK